MNAKRGVKLLSKEGDDDIREQNHAPATWPCTLAPLYQYLGAGCLPM